MPDILAARAQMGISLAFHIVFACVGVAMPLLTAIAEWLHVKTEPHFKQRKLPTLAGVMWPVRLAVSWRL
jgi:cytochrome bd-type quinol oxidase subunit 1